MKHEHIKLHRSHLLKSKFDLTQKKGINDRERSSERRGSIKACCVREVSVKSNDEVCDSE